MSYLPCLEIEPKEQATASIIWLHGLGADGNDFAPVIPDLKLANDLPVRFIFPHAPSMPVTINNGYVMPAWYDILEMSIERGVDVKQLKISAKAISVLIDREIERGIDSRRIVVAGFSQGGAVAYHCALTYKKPLAGILALSTYFATANIIEPSDANLEVPIFIGHGISDPVVPEMLGQFAAQTLAERNYNVTYKTYSMEHNVCMEEIREIGQWINLLLPESVTSLRHRE